MTEYVTLEDWVALVFGYLEDLTLDDLLEFNAAAAARALVATSATAGGVDLLKTCTTRPRAS